MEAIEKTLCLKMFGPFHVCRKSSEMDMLEDLRAHKMAEPLLALLTLYHGKALTKGEITTLLWGGGATESNLNKCITALVEGLGPDGWRVSTVARTVRLDLSGAEVDLVALDEAWER